MRTMIIAAIAASLIATGAQAQVAESNDIDAFLLSQLERRAVSWDVLERPQLDLSIWATDNQICNLWYEGHDVSAHESGTAKVFDVAVRIAAYPNIYTMIGAANDVTEEMAKRRTHLVVDDYCETAALQTVIN